MVRIDFRPPQHRGPLVQGIFPFVYITRGITVVDPPPSHRVKIRPHDKPSLVLKCVMQEKKNKMTSKKRFGK